MSHTQLSIKTIGQVTCVHFVTVKKHQVTTIVAQKGVTTVTLKCDVDVLLSPTYVLIKQLSYAAKS